MSIFRETPISWYGKEYTLVPSMTLLRRIEMGDKRREVPPLSLGRVIGDAQKGEAQFSIIMWIIEVAMQHAGVTEFTEDVAFQEFHSSGNKDILELWFAITAALSPVPKAEKKADAPESK